MAIVINGSGTVTGISVGGLPDGTVDAGTLADNSVDSDQYVDASIDNAHLADDAVGVAELSATGTASSSTFLRGDNSWAAAGGDNTPSFSVTNSSSQSYSSGVWTKVVLDTEQHDTDSAFDSSTNYRFTVPAGEGGTYVFTGQLTHDDMVDTGDVKVTLYKNGSQVTAATVKDYAQVAFSYNMHIPFTFTLDLAASDYVELWAKHEMGGTRYISPTYTRFISFKLVGV